MLEIWLQKYTYFDFLFCMSLKRGEHIDRFQTRIATAIKQKHEYLLRTVIISLYISY
jgi:hypothetical protein